MTREEAIERIKGIKDSAWGWHINGNVLGIDYDEFIEIMDLSISALRPVSRDQVEKVWRGKWNVSYDEMNGLTYVTCSKCGDETVLNGCFVTVEGEPCGLEGFCSACGAPMTDVAMDMVMKRLEALYEHNA